MKLRDTTLALSLLLGLMVRPMDASAQPPRQPNAAALLRAVERLAVVGNVLYVAAHPDDENTRLLSYLVGDRLLRTAYLSVTRGDGGQNLIGSEQGPLLGLIRTQELLAARRVDGAEQFFTRARDFGYSKTAAETLSIWGKDAVLGDMVEIFRRFRPDVVITRFSTQGGDTHGHHTASAMLAYEAFSAAADKNFHPEQVQRLGTWQVKRLLWNRSVWGGGRPSDDMMALPKMDIGGYDPLIGASWGEVAAESRSMHKSQGFGAAPSRGSSFDYFQPLLSAAGVAQLGAEQRIFDGLDLTWNRVPGGGHLAQLLLQARQGFDPRRPEASLPILLQARAELEHLPDNPFKAPKLQEINDVLAACLGLFVEVSASDYSVVPGGALSVTAVAINRSAVPVQLHEVRLPGGIGVPVDQGLAANKPWQLEHTLSIPADAPIGNPYWLAEAPEKGIYNVREPSLIGLPENPATQVVEFSFVLSAAGGQAPLTLRRPVIYKWTDPVAGERYRSIEVAPEVMVTPDAPVFMFPDAQARSLRLRLRAGVEHAAGTLRLELPPGYSAEPPALPFSIEKKGGESEVRFQIRPGGGAVGQGTGATGTLKVMAELGAGKDGRNGHRAFGVLHIDYPHIPIQTVFPVAEVKLCRFELKKNLTRIGYIAGAGDEVPAALRQVGYEVTLLSDEALERQPLASHQAIVVGVRAYNTNPRMAFHSKRLLDYVAAGGNLIVQYNTNNRLSKLNGALGPYPFEISQDRVTDENAAVVIEPAGHPLLARPNPITKADFDGWVQERGLYFADKWSDKYEAPLSMHDPGEPPKKGSVLIARHGKGTFIYTGLAFFRQLPAGVPGAYRLLANMIAYGK